MVSKDDALKICETVLAHAKAAGAEDAAVSLGNSVESHARFADNRVTTSGRAEDLDITARCGSDDDGDLRRLTIPQTQR